MKKLFTILSLSLWAATSIYAASLDEANQVYAAGDYQTAAALYEQILADEGKAPELYYNLGNAYYKTGEIGRAILNYERALQLRPFYSDARYNLEIARQRVVDNIEDTQSSFLTKWFYALVRLLTPIAWAVMSIIFFCVCMALLLCFAFAKRLWLRKLAFHTAVVCFIFTVLTGIFAGAAHQRSLQRPDAIIMQGVVSVKSFLTTAALICSSCTKAPRWQLRMPWAIGTKSCSAMEIAVG